MTQLSNCCQASVEKKWTFSNTGNDYFCTSCGKPCKVVEGKDKKEKMNEIVNLIALLAGVEGAIAVNIAFENAKSADHNRKIAERYKSRLLELLMSFNPQPQ